MPRRRKESPVIPTTALVASSIRYPGKAARIYQPRQNWQAECYRHYSICGEARFAAKFFGHAVSRATLYAATIAAGKTEVQQTGPLADLLDELFNGKDGQTQMLEAIGAHLTIAGECYLVGRAAAPNADDDTATGEVWEIVSCMEMQVTGDSWQINYGDGLPAVILTEGDVVIRIWCPNPRRRIEADSPFRSLLPILGEIEWLTRHVFAQVTSRLAGAGILFMPQSMTFPPPPAGDGQETVTSNEADTFMQVLADAMLTPIGDPGSPAAMVPIVVTAPEEAIDKAKLLTFWSNLDEAAMELRNEALRRFALGMDLPPEQILGLSSRGGGSGASSTPVSHWGAWQVEESTIKLHIEPMLDVIVNALTMGYLRPAIESGDPTSALIVYDSSSLRLRPDRSKESLELYDRGLITPKAVIRETGFDEADMPTPDEFKMWLLIKVASGSATPEQVQAALTALGIQLNVPAPVDAPPTRESRPTPSLEDHPTRDIPERQALLAACDALVYRALERAGNRLRQGGQRPPNVPAYETHVHVHANGRTSTLMDDAWSCAPQVLEGIADPVTMIPVLNAYCLNLIAEQSPHSRARLSQWLTLQGASA